MVTQPDATPDVRSRGFSTGTHSTRTITLIGCVFSLAVGLLLLYEGLLVKEPNYTAAGSILTGGSAIWYPLTTSIRALRSERTRESYNFWVARWLSSLGSRQFLRTRLGIWIDPFLEGAIVITVLAHTISILLLYGVGNLSTVIQDIPGRIWSASVTVFVFYYASVYPRSIQEMNLSSLQPKPNKPDSELLLGDGQGSKFVNLELDFLNRASKTIGLMFGVLFSVAAIAADHVANLIPWSTWYASPQLSNEFFRIGVFYVPTIPNYLFDRFSIWVFGIVGGVMISEALSTIRILTFLDSDYVSITASDEEAEPLAPVNKLLFSFWKTSASGLAFLPLFMLSFLGLGQTKPALPANLFILYTIIAYVSLLSVLFFFAVMKTSSITRKAKVAAIDKLRQDLLDAYQGKAPTKGKARTTKEIEFKLSEIRRIREVPLRAIAMQVTQALLSIIVALIPGT